MEFKPNQKMILEKFQKKVNDITCPICGNKHFTIIEGFTRRMINQDLHKNVLGGTNVPSISIVCNNCGHILDFALGPLGLLENKSDNHD